MGPLQSLSFALRFSADFEEPDIRSRLMGRYKSILYIVTGCYLQRPIPILARGLIYV